jgi:integrase
VGIAPGLEQLAFLVLAVRRGIIQANPMGLLTSDERPNGNGTKRKRFEWSPESISALISAAEQLDARPVSRARYAVLIRTAILTGLRIGELLALRWQDVDLLGGVLHVEHSLSRDGKLTEPKTEAAVRTVPLSVGLVEVLLAWKPEHAEDGDYVFPSRNGGPLSYWNVRDRGFAPAARAAGIEGISVHDLRHSAASLLVASGLSVVDVASILGHSDPSVTLKTYAHLFARDDAFDRARAAQEAVVLPGGTQV